MTNTKPKALGNINCYKPTKAQSGRKSFLFDGTTLGMTIAAVKAGIKVGSIIKESGYKYKLVSAPHDKRAGGYWAKQVWN